MNVLRILHQITPTHQSYGIFLRLLRQTDFPLFYALYGDSTMMSFIGTPWTLNQAEKNFSSALEFQKSDSPRYLTYVIVDSVSSVSKGVVGLQWHEEDRSIVEIGVMVLPKWQRMGVAHAAKSVLMDCAFNHYQVNSIYAFCSVDNVAANDANKKLGFIKSYGAQVHQKTNSQAWKMSLQHWQSIE